MKSIYKIVNIITICLLLILGSCDYLDVVPDNVATIDNAFRNRTEAEKYLFSCYSYRPYIGDLNNDPAMAGADENWQFYPVGNIHSTWNSSQIGRGFQSANEPVLNTWNGAYGARSLWRGIRDCNIFLENFYKVLDMQEYEKARWIAEIKFLKAYYHYYLMKSYGPIPITDVNLSVSASADELMVYRDPIDKVVEYITDLLLEATEDLPNANEVVEGTEAGRADKLIAMSLRAEVLLFAASPLFNGNTDYRSMTDNRGTQLFNQTYDVNKWKLAADACKEAIDLCHAQHKELYDLVDPFTANAPDVFKLQTTYREAICDRWNKELIWGSTNNNADYLSRSAHARLLRLTPANLGGVHSEWAATLKSAEQYYSANGVPIDEDLAWTEWYSKRYSLREEPSSGDEIYYVKEGQRTAYLHYNREPRFYASIGFDRGIYYGGGYFDFPDNVKHCEFINLEYSGFQGGDRYSVTGYSTKKMHSFKCSVTSSSVSIEYYPFPMIRLADLYLMYAEALNEYEGPSDEIFTYLDLIRKRAGLKGVKESWANHSRIPDKPASQDGLREIIRKERTIELAFEGKRFWDLRRWKLIEELNNPPQGWNIQGETAEDFYRVVDIARVPIKFTIKDYFWPIRESDLITNRNLIQNYGW
jgi:hypothetical protein